MRGYRRRTTIASVIFATFATLPFGFGADAPHELPAPAAWVAIRLGGGPQQPGQPVDQWASLNTNEEFERLLERADEIVKAGRPDLARILWQRVFDEGAGALASRSGGSVTTLRNSYRLYRPLLNEVEQRIVAAGPEALRAYRLHADGEARGLLSAADESTRERALAEVVRRFFLSSSGDDAAFELACRRLERKEFVTAAQLLTKLQTHPDDDIPAAAVVVRLAVALSRSGGAAAASQMIAAEESISSDVRTLLEADFAVHASPAHASPVTSPAIASPGSADAVGGLMGEAWEYRPEFLLKALPPLPQENERRRTAVTIINGRRVVLRRNNNGAFTAQPTVSLDKLPDLSRDQLARRWKAAGWSPAGTLRFADGRVLLKAEERLVCCDSRTGKVLWMGRRNAFPLDPQTRNSMQMQLSGYRLEEQEGRPNTPTEVVLFGDRVAQSMTVSGDVVVSVEGNLNYSNASENAKPQDETLRGGLLGMGQNGPQMGRNWLAAYDLRTGKLRWHRAAVEPPAGEASVEASGVVVGSPQPAGDLLLTPIVEGGRILLTAIDRRTGRDVWSTHLCDAPSQGQIPWIPVGLATDAGTVYVSTGAGAVFSLSTLDGRVHWAAGYPRRLPGYAMQIAMQQMAMNRRNPAASPPKPNQAEVRENAAVRHGDLLIVMAADADHLFALDHRTGELRWESPLTPGRSAASAEYCLGSRNGKLLVGGRKVVRAVDLVGGSLLWERTLDSSYGRGVLTADAVCVPQNASILQIDLDNGRLLGTIAVTTPHEEPVGNLFIDGGRLYMVGAARVAAPAAEADRNERSEP